jgi:hypothetical protein
VRNSLFARLVIMVTREFATSRVGDLHIGRAIELLEGDTLAIFQGVGSPNDLTAAIDQWKKLRGDQRLSSLVQFRDKKTAHLGALKPNIPALIYTGLFALSDETVDLIDLLAKGTGMANIKIRDNVDAKETVDAFWKPWTTNPQRS